MSNPPASALVVDGAGDRCLVPIVEWALRRLRPDVQTREPRVLARGGSDLPGAMQPAIAAYRPDILFVHRDAERVSLEDRRGEIPSITGALVRIVPVRMTEAWLLIDERAIRLAADNPNGRIPLELPALRSLESIPSPKDVLRELLLVASEARGERRRKRFRRDIGRRVQGVADTIRDFTILRDLVAYQAFEPDLDAALASLDREPDTRV